MLRARRVGDRYNSRLTPGLEYLSTGGASPWHCERAVNVNLKTWSATQSTWDPSGYALCPHSLRTNPCQHFSARYTSKPRNAFSGIPEKMFGWFLSLIWPRFRRGEYRETHNTQVCWSGWTNCWKSKNSQQILPLDNFSGAEWVSLSSCQVLLHDMLLNIFYLKCFARWVKGVCRVRGAQGSKHFAKSGTFACCICRLKVLW